MIKKNKLPSISLALSACSALLIFGYSPHDNFHPLYTMLSLLPLQLGALLWAYLNGHLKFLKIYKD
tara:strand:+ start:609 stop:806 length:198 start_codon:yes stop_codon:yes gene_type:complete